MSVSGVIGIVGALIFLAHFFVGLFSRTRIPDVLWLTLIGVLLGPVLHLVTPSSFGAVGPVFTTVTLVLILFESGIGLSLEVLRKALRGTFSLALLNFVVTMLVVSAVAHGVGRLTVTASLMLGAILGGTSPTVVIPLASRLEMSEQASTILFLESAIGDVLSIVIALALLQAAQSGNVAVGPVLGNLLAAFLFAAILGVVGAVAWSILLNRVRTLENSLMTTIAFVFVIYGIVQFLGFSGAIASLAFGAMLGNLPSMDTSFLKRFTFLKPISLSKMERAFFSEVVFLVKTFFFIYVGVSVQLTNMGWILFGLLMTALIFLFRIPVARFGVNKSVPKQDAVRMAIMAPRGLAAAVLASLPLQAKMPGGHLVQATAYSVIIFGIALTSLLVFLLEKTSLRRLYERIFAGFGESAEVSTSSSG